MVMLKSSGSIEGVVSERMAVSRLGKGFLQISISIMAIRLEGKNKTPPIYGALLGFIGSKI